jgi:hypothetical protein
MKYCITCSAYFEEKKICEIHKGKRNFEDFCLLWRCNTKSYNNINNSILKEINNLRSRIEGLSTMLKNIEEYYTIKILK